MYVMTCTRPDLTYPLNLLARYVAPGRHQKVHWDAMKRVLRYLCITSGMGLVLGGRGPVVLTGHADASWVDDSATQRSSLGYTFSLGAMAADELRWLTYLLTDLGEQPRLPPVLYVDNKAMIALCPEHRLEHRMKPIALRYFLARELQQRGQLRLAYVATRANNADIFTKALPPGDHQRFSTVLGHLALLFLTEAWKAEHGPVSMGTPALAPTNPSSTSTHVLAVEDEDVEDIPPPPALPMPSPAVASPLPFVADVPEMASPLTTGTGWRIVVSPSAPVSGIAGGRCDEGHLGGQVQKLPTTWEQTTCASAMMAARFGLVPKHRPAGSGQSSNA
ncbi:unnamed protein product [Closterium sp. NIES-53]